MAIESTAAANGFMRIAGMLQVAENELKQGRLD